MDINASEPVEVWLLESPQAGNNVPGPTTPSSLSVSERKKRRGSFFSKLFCSSDVDRANTARSKPSPAAESVDSQASRRSTMFSSSSPLATPSESSFGAENTEPQSMPAMTTPPRSSVKAFLTPQRTRPPTSPAAALKQTVGFPITTPQVAYSKGFYQKMSESSNEHEQSTTDERCSFHSASDVLTSHDDDEFLPDEFKATLQSISSSTDRESSIPDRLYSADQVQVIVNEALHQAHEEWQQTVFMKAQEEYEQTIAKLRKDAEVLMQVRKEADVLLEEHGNLTIRQHEDELDELRKKLENEMKLQAEQHEQEKVDLQLLLSTYKEGEIQALQSTVTFMTDAATKEREDFQKQIEDLKAVVDALQKQLTSDTESLRKELELSEAKNVQLLENQGDLEKTRDIDIAAKEDAKEKRILELQTAVEAVQKQLVADTDALRKELELSEARNLELLEKQQDFEKTKDRDISAQDDANHKEIEELKAAVAEAQKHHADDTALLRRELELLQARNVELLEKQAELDKAKEVDASSQDEANQRQIAELKAAVDVAQMQLTADTESLRKELDLSEARNLALLEKQAELEKAKEVEIASADEASRKQILELQGAVDALQMQLAADTESLRKELELAEARNLELVDKQRDFDNSKLVDNAAQDEANQKQIAELTAAVEGAQKQLAADTESLRRELEQSETRNLELLEKLRDLDNAREIGNSAEEEANQERIAELKAAVDLAQKQLVSDTEAFRKELELSEARNAELLEKQRNLEKAKDDEATAEKTLLNEKIEKLEQEKLGILEERDRQLQGVRDEANAEIQRIKDEFSVLVESERSSAERAITAASDAEFHQRLQALKIEHSQEIDQRLDALKLEHSQAIEQLQKNADLRVLQVQLDKDIEFQAQQTDLKSRLDVEWSKEKQDLVDKVTDLESRYAAEHSDFESRLQTLQVAHAKEIERIQNEAVEQRDRLHQELLEQYEKARSESEAILLEKSSKEKRDILDEIEKLRLENTSLHADHERAVVSLQDGHSQEVENLRQEAERIRIDTETKAEDARRQTERGLLESHTSEKAELIASVDELKSAIEALRNEHEFHVESLKQEHIEYTAQLRQSADEQIANWRLEIEKQSDIALRLEQVTNDKKSLEEVREKMEAELHSMRTNHEEMISSMTSEHQLQIEEIRNNAEELVERVRAEASNGNENLEALTKEAKETAELVARLQADLIGLRTELDQSKELLKQSNEKEKSLVSKVAALEARTEADRTDFERQLIERQELTNKEIEETIAQLDLLVEEHNQEKVNLERSIQDKDAIIAALGAQLAEAQRRMTALEEAHMQHSRELESARHEALMAQEAIDSLKATVEHMKIDHKKTMEAEHTRRLKDIEQAREETIAEAESQFQRANDIYIQLKKEYDASCHKISKLEAEVKHARSEIEQNRKVQASKEMELAAELAHVKARLATSEADAARQIQEYAVMLNQLQVREKELAAKLDEAHGSARTTHLTLAAVVAEKERLIRENEEMKAVCEELMGMIEGQQKP